MLCPGLSWHANLLRYGRRKCLLFMHDQTLFSIFLPSVTKADYPHLVEMFGQRLFRAMRLFDFNQQQIETMLEQARELRFDKTNSRSCAGIDERLQAQYSIFLLRIPFPTAHPFMHYQSMH
jgi:hypothetical protein